MIWSSFHVKVLSYAPYYPETKYKMLTYWADWDFVLLNWNMKTLPHSLTFITPCHMLMITLEYACSWTESSAILKVHPAWVKFFSIFVTRHSWHISHFRIKNHENAYQPNHLLMKIICNYNLDGIFLSSKRFSWWIDLLHYQTHGNYCDKNYMQSCTMRGHLRNVINSMYIFFLSEMARKYQACQSAATTIGPWCIPI